MISTSTLTGNPIMGVRTYPNTPRVYLDMDGPLANFDKAALEHGMSPSHFKRVAGAYLGLAPTPGAKDAVAAMLAAGLQVFALTKTPKSNPYAATEKLLWIREHFPDLDDKVIISSDKGAVGTARDFLVDDHPEWANADKFPGKIVHFKFNWADSLAEILGVA